MGASPNPATGTGWDETIPDVNQPHGNDYNEHQETKKAVRIRIEKEHEDFGTSSAGGEHLNGAAVVYMGAASPTNRPDAATALASNNIDKGRLWLDDTTTPPVLKRWNGSAWAQVSVLANNQYLTAVDATGTGTVNLIKANASDVAILPDGSELASSAAPTTDAGLANKKYVDDNVGAANYTPSSYAGEQSITFPNGLIIKQGTKTAAAASTVTITFSAAFPSSLLVVIVQGNAYDTNDPTVTSKHATDSFNYKQGGGSHSAFDWIAIGY